MNRPLRTVDAGPSEGEDTQQFLLWHLLHFFPGPYAMLAAYVDESGTHAKSPVTCVAGVLYERDRVKRLDSQWKKALREAGIRHFHATDYANLQGEFRNRDRHSSDQLYLRLLELLRTHACGWAATYTLPKTEFDTFRKGKWDYGQYATCAHFCMLLLRKVASQLHHEKVSFVIEAGHENMGELRNLLKELSELGYKKGSWQFNEKEDMRPLQTADIIAYESWKRISEQFNADPRPLRKSLESLIVGTTLQGEVFCLGKKEIQYLIDRKAEIMGE